MDQTATTPVLEARRPSRLSTLACLAAITCFASPPSLDAQGVCSVPSTHATVQSAVDDPVCSSVSLASGIQAESVLVDRSLVLFGPGASQTTILGKLVIAGAATVATLADLTVESGCSRSLDVVAGAEVVTDGVEVLNSPSAPCPLLSTEIFRAGFETGDTSEWSASTP
ncbi:MAG: hypothetical protein DWQ36_09265 [Acidobacteria bacterium]|nr:MAG: hypothetical protein DWQ30_22510 [Acidobacteriota bacterium]REK08549.1 MAG: hypothetical protein DWQ36_09265 [Acidobacteriota bacterium]